MSRARSVRRSPDMRSQGSASPFRSGAACVGNLVLLAALIWWRAPRRPKETLPAERLISAMMAGVRYVRYSREMDATLIRAIAFFPFASAYLALLPLVARSANGDGAEVYGELMAAVGVGSIVATFALNWLKSAAWPERARRARHDRHRRRTVSARRGARARTGARRELRRRRRLDRRADHLFRLGAGGPAGMGAGTGPGDFPHRLFRRADARERGVGRSRQAEGRALRPRCAGVGALIGMALTWRVEAANGRRRSI